MLNYPDELGHNNKNLALLDGDTVRGGRRWVPDRYSLYRLAEKRDQLKAGVTVVRVQEDEENNLLPTNLLLVDMDNLANAAGWQVESAAAAGAGIDSFTNELGKLTITSGDEVYVADLNTLSASVFQDAHLIESNFATPFTAGDVNAGITPNYTWYNYQGWSQSPNSSGGGNYAVGQSGGRIFNDIDIPNVGQQYVVRIIVDVVYGGGFTVNFNNVSKPIAEAGTYEIVSLITTRYCRLELSNANAFSGLVSYCAIGQYVSGQVYGDNRFASLTRDQVLAGKTKFSATTDIKKLLVDGNQALNYYLQGGYYGTLQVGGSGLKFIQLTAEFVDIQAGLGLVRFNQYGTIESNAGASFAAALTASALYANNLQGAGGRMVQANGSGQLVADPNAPQFDGTTFTINGGLAANVVKAKGVDLLAAIATKQPALVSFIQTSSYGSSEYYVPDFSLNQAVQLGILEETTVFLPTLNANNIPATFWLLNPPTNRYSLFVRGQTGANSAGSEGLLLVLRPGEQARFDSVSLKRYYPFTTDAPVYIVNTRSSSNYLNAPLLANGACNVTEVLSLKQYAGGLSFDFSGLLGGDSRLTLDANEDTLAFTGRFINPDGTYRQVPFQEFNDDVVNFGVPVSISKGATTSSLTINNSDEPPTNPDGGVTWVENGTLWYKGSNGTKTPLAPA